MKQIIDINEQCENAQRLAMLNPVTFQAPKPEDLLKVIVGDSVKICVGGERFWCSVIHVEFGFGFVTATIDNDLVRSEEHGLKYKDVVKFKLNKVYTILEKEN